MTMDASMMIGAWRLNGLLPYTLSIALIMMPSQSWAGSAANIIEYYQNAYVHGRDLIPLPQSPLDTTSLEAELNLKTIRPTSVLTGSSFLTLDGTIVKLAGAQGCLSTDTAEFAGQQTTCAMISLAGMTAILIEAKAAVTDAFPCHFFGQAAGTPSVLYGECFFVQNGEVKSLSEMLIARGLAFAARDGAGHAVFSEYERAEQQAQRGKAGIWANTYFVHPYGAHYRTNLSTN